MTDFYYRPTAAPSYRHKNTNSRSVPARVRISGEPGYVANTSKDVKNRRFDG